MKYTNKKGIALVELVVSLTFVALIIAAGTAIYLIAMNGFTGGTESFNTSSQALLFKKLLDTNLPLVSTVSAHTPSGGSDSILFEDGAVVYVQNYGEEDEVRYVLNNATSVTFNVDEVGERCRFRYQLVLQLKSGTQTFSGAVIMLNIRKTSFESENAVTLPCSYTISAASSAQIYLIA